MTKAKETKTDTAALKAQLQALAAEEVEAVAPIRAEAEALAADNAANVERLAKLRDELNAIQADGARIDAAFKAIEARLQSVEADTGAGQRAIADITALRPAAIAGLRAAVPGAQRAAAGAEDAAARELLRQQVNAIAARREARAAGAGEAPGAAPDPA